MTTMYSHWPGSSNGDGSWPAHYSSEYVTTKPWYEYFWHSDGKITPQKFNRIQLGITRQQVIDIIGGPGRVRHELLIGKTHSVTVIYRGSFWSPTLSATLTFHNGLLQSKSSHR